MSDIKNMFCSSIIPKIFKVDEPFISPPDKKGNVTFQFDHLLLEMPLSWHIHNH